MRVRLPRIVLFLYTLGMLASTVLTFYGKGFLSPKLFMNPYSLVMSGVFFLIVFLISIRSLFYCKQVTCAAVCIAVCCLFYQFVPPFVKKGILVTFFIALWAMMETVREFKINERKNANNNSEAE